jgi:phosphoglycerate dehydrogenase-like enzyme
MTSTHRPKSILLISVNNPGDIYSSEVVEKISRHTQLLREDVTQDNFASVAGSITETEVIFSTWGMPVMNERFFELLPNVRAVFYAAGTVKLFVTDSVWRRNVTISSAWMANAVPVTEFTVASIILSLKSYWPITRRLRTSRDWLDRVPISGAYGTSVGLVSLGAIGRMVAERLKTYDMEVLAYDPIINPKVAADLGVRLVDLEELFSTCQAVSIHTPLLPATTGMIGADLIRKLPPNATLINTSRGAIIDEPAMISTLIERPDITAVLDVTAEEPLPKDSKLFELPNVVLSPHIAGSTGHECRRMGQMMFEEYERWVSGQPLLYQIDEARLATIA